MSQGSITFNAPISSKCNADSIWQKGLMYKLYDVMPRWDNWVLLCRWYEELKATVRGIGVGLSSTHFQVTKSVRQGSILSPCIFNVFIDGLLRALHAGV